jgi:hypothetical protein
VNAPPHALAAGCFLLLTGAITLSAEWGGVFLVPQPQRYHMAMDMAFAMAASSLVPWLWRRLPQRARWAAAAVIAAVCVLQAFHVRRWADGLIQPIDIRQTTEYKTARWFERNLGGRRVMAPGSTSFFLNAFNDTPQLGGGFVQGATDWHVRVAIYVIYTGQNAGARDAEYSVLWLKAMGVSAVAVGGPGSGEFYKPFANPYKFEGVLKEVWREGDDRIYLLPGRTGSLAHVVRRGDLVARAPVHGLDVEQVRRYVAALDDPALPAASLRWLNRHQARISGEVRPGQVLSVQMAYHPGWLAEVAGRRVPVERDAIGLTWVDPGCDGACTVNLTYDGGMEMRAAKAASAGGFFGCLLWAAVRRAGRRRERSV